MGYFESMGLRDADAEWSPVEPAVQTIRVPEAPRGLQEQTEAILRLLDNPSVLGATPERVTTPNRYELWETPAGHEWGHAIDPPARNLGDEMVMLAGGIAAAPWRVLPFGVRAASQGVTHLRALGNESQQAIDQVVRSFMNRLGRMPLERELIEALGLRGVEPGHAQPGGGEQDAPGGWNQPMLREGGAPGRMVGPGEAVAEPYSFGQPDLPEGPSYIDEIYNAMLRAATDAQRRLGEVNDRMRGRGERSFQTYVRDNLYRPTVYDGRTSGFGSPYENVARRGQKKYPSADYGEPSLDRSSNRYSSIRGRAQQMIDYHRMLGMSDNKYNDINPYNPLRDYYMRNADREFGTLPPRERK